MRLGPFDLKQESEDFYVGHQLGHALNILVTQVRLELSCQQPRLEPQAQDCKANEFVRRCHHAACTASAIGSGRDSCLSRRPGSVLGRRNFALLPRAIGNYSSSHSKCVLCGRAEDPRQNHCRKAHSVTGIDIHPGATSGSQFCIDHGTGVVVGETAVIGERVRLYQAVTLVAVRFDEDDQGALTNGEPRHPIVEDDVVTYAGATILGRITIGRGAVIGGNVWLTRDVPPGSRITQAVLRQSVDT